MTHHIYIGITDDIMLEVELEVGLPEPATRHCPGDSGSIDVMSISDDHGNEWSFDQADLLVRWSGAGRSLDAHIESQWMVIMEAVCERWQSDRDDSMVDRWESSYGW